eukprot:951867-Pyramimonas_sp.AAC.1
MRLMVAPDSLAIVTINADAWGGARTVLEWSADASLGLDIAFIQETRFPVEEAAGSARQWRIAQGSGPPRRVGTERLAVSG